MVSWSVCSTVKEPFAVLDRFVRHHLDVGASYVHLFFDDPTDPSFAVFKNQPGVVAQLCDDRYWAQLGRRRPPHQERRQKINATFAYNHCQTDWQAHFDADELLLSGFVQKIGHELADLPPDTETAKIEPIEPLYVPDASGPTMLFKKSGRGLRHRKLARTFGAYLPLLNHAMIGHSHGKSFLRSGLSGWSHGIHRPRPPRDQMRTAQWLDGPKLAHLHCLDREDWLRRVMTKTRNASYSTGGALSLVDQLRTLLGAQADQQSDVRILGHFYEGVNCYSGRLKDRLDRNEMILPYAIDLSLAAPELATA